MQIVENLNVKEKVYIDKLENGLTVMVIPKKETQKKYVIWGTNYGSIDNEFIVPGEKEITKVPNGIAHFLEHKMFEQPDGTNSLDTLTALGVNANAYTTNDHTAYLFECTDNFYEALDELMDYVQHPYFTDENVQKEQGIIGQEIMMYDDYPSWKVYLNALQAMYQENPIRIDITGTIETISKINKELLYKCYSTFYHPSNMVMVLCGNFEPEKIIQEVKKRLLKKENQSEIKRIYPNEPEKIKQKVITENMEVSIPLFVIGYKMPEEIEQKEERKVTKHIAIEILLNILIGKSSELYQKLYEEGLLISEPDLSFDFSKNYAYIMITGQSSNPEKIEEEWKKQVEKYKASGISEEEFQRVKKTIYGNYVKEYNDVGDIARMFLADYFKGINSFEYLEQYEAVSKTYVEDVLKQYFLEEKEVLSMVKPKT